MCTLQAVVMLCFIFDEESFSKMFLSVGARERQGGRRGRERPASLSQGCCEKRERGGGRNET